MVSKLLVCSSNCSFQVSPPLFLQNVSVLSGVLALLLWFSAAAECLCLSGFRLLCLCFVRGLKQEKQGFKIK